MKKFLLFISIIMVSFLCTACINNIAIQELNQIGKEYLEKGDYDNAIARFQSCVDLDENIFVSRYNLGVAYISKEDFKNAITTLKRAIEIDPTSKNAYYSLAVALEADAFSFEKKENPTTEQVKTGVEEAKQAVQMYEKYLELAFDADDKDKVEGKIKEINSQISHYSKEYKLDDMPLNQETAPINEEAPTSDVEEIVVE